MGLGSDGTVCTTELAEAMRARLEAEKPGSGANVDLPEVKPNFAALGAGVFQILTARAEVFSDPPTHPQAFWQWVADVQAWVAALAVWQAGVTQAFNAWAPTLPADAALKVALTTVTAPGAPPAAAPTTLTGGIR